MKNVKKRLCIFPQDVAAIKGVSIRQARNIINDIKVFHKKEKHHIVTVKEFCTHFNLPIDEVENYLM